ncbi:MAG TPA: hypothetical protein VFA04_22620 [Bryobacteraceae bacterium]|nr:hypothetical protein [Bryobacteraceae bacterium]
MDQFVNAEDVDTKRDRFQVPFLVDTRYRASVEALPKDLDGSATPTLTIVGPGYLPTKDGTATVPFPSGMQTGRPRSSHAYRPRRSVRSARMRWC